MLIAVGLQASITLFLGALVWLAWGPMQALSLAAGGVAIVFPNALLAIAIIASPRLAVPVVLLVGELMKVGLSVLLLWISYRLIAQLSWGALIFGMVAALLSVLLVPWCQQRFDQRSAPDGG